MRPAYFVLALSLVTIPGCSDDPTSSADPTEELLEEIRGATAAFADVESAETAGFAPASPCVAGPDGAMGVHYLNESRIDAVVAASEPELLLYEPGAGGSMELVGVEYMVLAPAWDADNPNPPALVGQDFADHRAEEARHGIPFPHYDLHVWAWRENPDGALMPFNPQVSCPTN